MCKSNFFERNFLDFAFGRVAGGASPTRFTLLFLCSPTHTCQPAFCDPWLAAGGETSLTPSSPKKSICGRCGGSISTDTTAGLGFWLSLGLGL